MYRSIDQIETELAEMNLLASRVDARRVQLIRELDQAQVATADGARTMVDWVTARCDVEPATARRFMDLARANVPLDDELDSGMSLERAAAVARLRAAGADEETIDRSFGFDLAGMRRLTASERRISREDEIDIARSRFCHIQPNLDESVWNMWARFTGVDGRTVEKAVLAQRDSLPDNPHTTATQDTADALVSICAGTLHDSQTGGGTSGPAAEVFIDAALATSSDGEQGVTVAGGPRVGPQVLEEILCSGTINVIVSGDKLETVRTHGKTIPPATRAYVMHRDGHACVIDGCRSRTRLQPHHITPRSEGGDHHPDNLATLCWYHHHIAIHTMGLQLDPDSPPQRRRFIRTSDRTRDGP